LNRTPQLQAKQEYFNILVFNVFTFVIPMFGKTTTLKQNMLIAVCQGETSSKKKSFIHFA
jgi:hypothetical protein